MKALLQTHSASYAQSLRLELEAAGIETTLLDEQAPMYMSFAGRIRLAVVHDADFDRAMAVVRSFEASRGGKAIPPSWHWQRAGLVTGGIGFVLLVVSGVMTEKNVSQPVVYALFVAAIGLLGIGFALVFVGPRRDRPQP